MDYNFLPKTLSALIDAGWSDDWRASEVMLKEKLIEEGYKFNSIQLDFLIRFEGLVVTFFNIKKKKDDDFNFLLDRAFNLEVVERIVGDYEKRIGFSVCPIGTAYNEHFVLIMDVNGAIYGGYDDYLVKIGNSFVEAMNAIIYDYDFVEI